MWEREVRNSRCEGRLAGPSRGLAWTTRRRIFSNPQLSSAHFCIFMIQLIHWPPTIDGQIGFTWQTMNKFTVNTGHGFHVGKYVIRIMEPFTANRTIFRTPSNRFSLKLDRLYRATCHLTAAVVSIFVMAQSSDTRWVILKWPINFHRPMFFREFVADVLD